MRAAMLAFLMLAVAFVPPPAAAASPPDLRRAQPDAFPALVAQLMPAVVNISILRQRTNPAGATARGEQDMGKPVQEFGSGFVIDRDGYIVTNRHVIARAYKVMVTFNDGTQVPARVLASNERPDLALLKVDVGHPLPTVPWGNDGQLAIGDTVFAIGNPLGLSGSVTVGIVSALNRDVGDSMFDTFIQTDAAINHGNSGGPLFNMQGQVVGVNWALLSPTDTGGSIGLGLSIPARVAEWVVGQMRQYGRIRPGWIGAGLQPISQEIARAIGRPDIKGAIIAEIVPNHGAAKSGLTEGDVLLAFNGVDADDVREASRAIAAATPGSTVPASIWRDGRVMTIQVAVENWPDDDTHPAGPPINNDRGQRMNTMGLGLRLAPLTDRTRKDYALAAGEKGLVVTGVAANSPGADAGFAPGDVIVRIGDRPIASERDLRQAVGVLAAKGVRDALVLVRNSSGVRWRVATIPARPSAS